MLKAFFTEPTREQWAAFLAAWVGWVLDAFDFTIFLFVIPAMAKEFHVSLTATASTITITLLLRLVGGLFAGTLADRFGRRLPLMISIVWFAVCDGAIYFAPSFAWVLALRTLFGLGMGAEWTAGATLAMESWPEKTRGIASGVLQGSWAIGYMAAGIVSGLVTPHYGWRPLFLIAAIPALVVLPIRIFVKEPPEFHARAKEPKPKLSTLLTPELVRNLLLGAMIMTLGFGGYYGLTGLYPTLLKTQLHLTPGAVSAHVTLFNVGMMVGAITCGTLAARRGVVLAITVPALLCVLALPLYVGQLGNLTLLGAVLAGAFGAGYSGVTPLLLTTLFPGHVRARAVGLVYHAGAAMAAGTPTLIAALAEHTHHSLGSMMAWVTGACQVLLALALIFRPRSFRLDVTPQLPVVETLPAAPTVATVVPQTRGVSL